MAPGGVVRRPPLYERTNGTRAGMDGDMDCDSAADADLGPARIGTAPAWTFRAPGASWVSWSRRLDEESACTSSGSVGASASGLENDGVVLWSDERKLRPPGVCQLGEAPGCASTPASVRVIRTERAVCMLGGTRARADALPAADGTRRAPCSGVLGSS